MSYYRREHEPIKPGVYGSSEGLQLYKVKLSGQREKVGGARSFNYGISENHTR